MLLLVSFLRLSSLQGLSLTFSFCFSKYCWFETKPAAPAEFKKSAPNIQQQADTEILRWVSALVELSDMCCCKEKGDLVMQGGCTALHCMGAQQSYMALDIY